MHEELERRYLSVKEKLFRIDGFDIRQKLIEEWKNFIA